MKKCNKCKKEYSIDFFSKDLSSFDKLQARCNKCNKKICKEYRRTKTGLVYKIYAQQKKSSIQRGHVLPEYSKEELYKWIKKQDNFEGLYKNWANSSYDRYLVPSVDRVDDYKPYTLKNIRLVTWRENEARSFEDRKKGINNKISKTVYQYDKCKNFIKEWYSSQQAQRELGIFQANISKVALGQRNYAGGFIWSYKKLHG